MNKETTPVCATPINSVDIFQPNSGAAYIPRGGSFSYACIDVLPELVGKRWSNAALALVTGLRPSYIRVSNSGTTLDNIPNRITVMVHEGDPVLIKHISMEVQIELVGGDLKNGGDVRNRLRELCSNCGERISTKPDSLNQIPTPYHNATASRFCNAGEMTGPVAEWSAAPTPYTDPNELCGPNVYYGPTSTVSFPMPREELVTTEQLLAALEDIKHAARRFDSVSPVITEDLPSTPLHRLLLAFVRHYSYEGLQDKHGTVEKLDPEKLLQDACNAALNMLEALQLSGLNLKKRIV